MAISYVGAGAAVTGTTAALTVAWPTGLAANDVGIMLVERSGGEAAPTITGWTQIATNVDVASTTGSRFAAYWARSTGTTMTSASVPAAADHGLARIYVFRGCTTTGTPYNVVGNTIKTTASTTCTIPTVTTTVDGSMILGAISRPNDLASTTSFGTLSGMGLTWTEAGEAGTISGNGGGFKLGYSSAQTTAGATGTATCTATVSTTNVNFTIALTPFIPPAPTVKNPVQYRSDYITPIATGEAITDTNNIVLGFDVRNGADTTGQQPAEGNSVNGNIEIDILGTSFSNVASSTSPFPLYTNNDEPRGLRASAWAYDTIGKRFIMFGGSNGTTEVNEVWELRIDNNKGKWRQLSPTGTAPIARYQGNMVFDAANNRMLTIFGYTTTDTNEVWELKFTSSVEGAWTKLTPGGTAPSVRSNVNQSIVNYPENKCAYVFAGWGAAYYNGIYKLDYSTVTPSWTTLAADGAAGAPGIRRSANLFLDKVNNRLIAWGGAVSGTTYDTALYACSLSTGAWTTLSPTGGVPTGREFAASGVDPVNNRAYVWGGWQNTVATMSQTLWSLDMNTTQPVWRNLTPSQAGYMPLAVEGGVFEYDPDHNILLLWSGVDSSNDLQHHVTFLDLTEWPTNVFYGLAMNHAPRPMDAPGVAYDPTRDVAVLVGGYSQISDNINYDVSVTTNSAGHVQDVFEYNHTTNEWRQAIAGLKTFPHREGIAVAYDSVQDRILAFGGMWGAGTGSLGSFNDIWELKRNTNGDYVLRQMQPTGTPPGNRWLASACFDATLNRFILTGGNNSGGSNYNDVWELSFATDATNGVWTQRTPTGTAPTAWWAGGTAADTPNRKLYIYGGCTSGADGTFTNQFKMLDYSTTNCAWTILSSTSGPTARRSMGASVDPFSGGFYVACGYNGTTVLSDFYRYDIVGGTWTLPTYGSASGGALPAARRSLGSWARPLPGTNAIHDFSIYFTHGRPVSGNWYGDTYEYDTNNQTTSFCGLTPTNYLEQIRFPFTSQAYGSYHWQAWATDAAFSTVSSTPISYGGNAETAADYIITIATNASLYTKAGVDALPTTNTDLATSFTTTEYTNASTTDSVFVDDTSTNTYNAFEFKQRHPNNTDNITGTWVGKSTLDATSGKPLTLQIWNTSTSAWETIATNTTATAETVVTLTGTISTSLANYYDSLNIVTFRVYQ